MTWNVKVKSLLFFVKGRLRYWLYEAREKPRKMIHNQLTIATWAAFALPAAWVLAWAIFATLAQYFWVFLLAEAIIAPIATIDYVRRWKERRDLKYDSFSERPW